MWLLSSMSRETISSLKLLPLFAEGIFTFYATNLLLQLSLFRWAISHWQGPLLFIKFSNFDILKNFTKWALILLFINSSTTPLHTQQVNMGQVRQAVSGLSIHSTVGWIKWKPNNHHHNLELSFVGGGPRFDLW